MIGVARFGPVLVDSRRESDAGIFVSEYGVEKKRHSRYLLKRPCRRSQVLNDFRLICLKSVTERVTKSVVVVCCLATAFRGKRKQTGENRKLTTLNGGSLGSWVDEGRCKMRADM